MPGSSDPRVSVDRGPSAEHPPAHRPGEPGRSVGESYDTGTGVSRHDDGPVRGDDGVIHNFLSLVGVRINLQDGWLDVKSKRCDVRHIDRVQGRGWTVPGRPIPPFGLDGLLGPFGLDLAPTAHGRPRFARTGLTESHVCSVHGLSGTSESSPLDMVQQGRPTSNKNEERPGVANPGSPS